MAKYLIEEAKCGITDGGVACGPVEGTVVAEVKFKKGRKTMWLCLSETEGIPEFTLADRDIYDDLMKEDVDDGFVDYLEEHRAYDMDGLELGEDYEELFANISDSPDAPVIPLIRYIIALVRCDMSEVGSIIAMAQGRYADELDIPVSDVEEEYTEDPEQE